MKDEADEKQSFFVILAVTDLGSSALSEYLVANLSLIGNCKSVSFPSGGSHNQAKYLKLVANRYFGALKLLPVLLRSIFKRETIVISGIMPLFYFFPYLLFSRHYVVTDFVRLLDSTPRKVIRRDKILFIIQKIILRISRARIICLTEWIYRRFQRYYGINAKRLFLIPPPRPLIDDFELQASSSAGTRSRARFLFVGNDMERKGGADLIRWIEGNPEVDADFIFVTNSKFDISDPRIEKITLGREDKDKLFDLYRSSDVLLVPSRADAFPIVIVEALSIGVPVIALETARGAKSVILNSVNGYIEIDFNAFTDRIRAFCDSPFLLHQLKERTFLLAQTSPKFEEHFNVVTRRI